MDRRSSAQLPKRSPRPSQEHDEAAEQSRGAPSAGVWPGAAAQPSRSRSGTDPGARPGAAAAASPAAPPARQPQRSLSPDPRGGPGPPPDDPAGSGQLSPALSQNLDNTEDMFAGHELYRALRGSQGDDPLTDSMLWDGDFLTSQREFLQKQQEEQLLERLERRMGRIKAKPLVISEASASGDSPAGASSSEAAGGDKSAFVAAALAVATGSKLKSLIGKIMPGKSSVPAAAAAAAAAAAGASSSVDGMASAPGSLPVSPVKPAAGLGASFVSTPSSITVDNLGGPPSPGGVDASRPAASPKAATPTAAGAADAASRRTSSASQPGASQPTTPRFLAKLASSFLKSPRGPPLGNLVAEDPQQAAAGQAGTAPDGVVEVTTLQARKAALKAAEEKAKQEKEAIDSLDTARRLELGAERDNYSWIRRTSIKICTHSDFELIVLLLIFGNCFSLAAYDPLEEEGGPHNTLIGKIDLALNICFTVEMVLRILSMGGLLAYLSHTWNAFDAVMVLAGYTTFIPVSSTGGGLEGIKALRALRALRPLRTIIRFPALRSIVVCFLEAVPLLVSVAAMLFFFLFLFAVAGTELFGDAFHWGCIDPATNATEAASALVGDEYGCGDRQCPPQFQECHLFDSNQASEIAGFDNVGLSMLSVFQAMTLSNWSFTMYRTMDFLSPALVIYWFVLIIFGAYFVLNLFLAVLKTKFAKAKNLLDEKRRARRMMRGTKEKQRQNVLMRMTGWAKGHINAFMVSRADKDALASHVNEVMAKRAASEAEFAELDSSSQRRTTDMALPLPPSGVPPLPGAVNSDSARQNAAGEGGPLKPQLSRQLSRSSMGSGYSGYSGYTGVTGTTGMTGMSGGTLAAECLLSIEEFDESVQDQPRRKRWPMMLQYRIRCLVCNEWFNNVFLLAIVANTICLAITHEGMSDELEQGLSMANMVFTMLFTFEMLVRMAGLGAFKYLTDPWSLFDALVVAFSLVELVTELMARSNASGLSALRSVRSLRVLRSFRVLRVMKMFKYLESLKMIASVLISSMGSFASIVVLLVLFWMVFSIMGLHVFGGQHLDVPWPNCDTLVNALILNFNTLNLENFQTTMYSVIRDTSFASSAFWLAWIVLGKYIFLTLFLAVTLDAFERKYEVDMKKGVRSQSVASSVFSRIKKAGQRIKGAAASMTGSNSDRSGMFGSLWGGHSTTSSKAGTVATATGGWMAGGKAAPGGAAGGSASGGDAKAAKAAAASAAGRAEGAEGQETIAAFRGGATAAAAAVSSGGAAGRRVSVSHADPHAAVHRHRHSTDGERRRSSDGRQHTAAAGICGPVAEGLDADGAAPAAEYPTEGWGSGIRQRRHHIGLQMQYGLLPRSTSGSSSTSAAAAQHATRGGSRGDEAQAGGGAVLAVNPLFEGGAPGAGSFSRQHTYRRSSSSGGGSGSSSSGNSFVLKREAAGAFAAAAAAEALMPLHAFPELVDSSSDDEGNSRRRRGSTAPGPDHMHALSDLLHFSHPYSSTARHHKSSSTHHKADNSDEEEFTWHELLSTVDAIDHPMLVRQQRQQQQQSCSFRGGATAAAADGLQPIAEGVEGEAFAGARPAAGFSMALMQDGNPGVATLSHGMAGAAAAVEAALSRPASGLPAAAIAPRPPPSPRPALKGGRSAARQQQQQLLSLDALDSELRSLELAGPQAHEPTTPSFLSVQAQVSSATGAAAAATQEAGAGSGVAAQQQQQQARWPGLLDDLEELVSDGLISGTSAAGTKQRPQLQQQQQPNGEGGASSDSGGREAPPAAAAAMAVAPAAGVARVREQRRVTLFTESMRHRGEGPQVPASPRPGGQLRARFCDGPGSGASGGPGGPGGVGSSSQPLDELDELLGDLPGLTGPDFGGLGGGGGGGDVAALLGGDGTAGLLVEPCITAKAIKRRKAAAAVTFDATGGLPGAAMEGAASINSLGPQSSARASRATSDAASSAAEPLGVESTPPSESQSGAGGSHRVSRAHSDNASDLGGSEGRLSINSHTQGSQRLEHDGRQPALAHLPELSGVSLGLLSESNAFRGWLYALVTNRWFDYLMFLFIVLNCVAMAYEYPDISKEDLDGTILYWSDVVFTVCFTIEALLKVVAFGFRPYLSFFQNQTDLLIVVSSLAMLFLDALNLEIIKALRVLRAIKPLRALTRSAGMQLIFKSLTLSLAAMGNVSIVVLLFFLIFAILGVQLFHGKFYSCNDGSVPDKATCTGTFQLDGQEVPRVWSNLEFNFDNLGMALVSLFVTVTLNGYTEIMWAAMAAPEEPGLQPQPMSNWSSFFFFVAFVLVVAYTLLNLYIGVVFYQFSRIRMQSQTGSAFLTDDQTEWVELSRLVFRLKPPEKSPVPPNKFRKQLYYLVQSKRFEGVLMAVIVANSALMATTYYGMSEEMSRAVEGINYAFTCAYAIEFLLKTGGLGWANYWKISWNKFDLILLLSSIVDMIVALVLGSHASFLKVQKILRLLRLARVVKLMRSMKGLRSLFGTLIVSLPAFWNVGALLGLLFFMYAYVGMLLLGRVKRNGGLNEHTNFSRFWTAALTLFRVATNDNWTDVMTACMIKEPACDPSKGECGSWVVYPYFLSFVLLVTIIMLNLFTAVIIESFEAQQEQDRWKLRPDHLDEFVELWAEYDDGSGTIDPKDLEGMLLRLSPPLGLGSSASSTDVLRFVFDLDIPLLAGRVPFQRTAYELVRRCSGAEIPQGILKDQIDRLVARAFKNLKADEVLNFSVAVTVMRVQRKWRARMRAAKLKRKREFRAERGVAPAYADVIASRDTILKSALARRQGGDLRWRPNAAYAQQWAAADASLAADQAAAAAAAAAAGGGGSGSGGSSFRQSYGGAGPGFAGGEAGGEAGGWPHLSHLRASADGWLHRVTDGLQRLGGRVGFHSGAGGGAGEPHPGAASGRSSLWGFSSCATSKALTSAANSNIASRAASETVSRAASEAASRMASEAVSQQGSAVMAAPGGMALRRLD